ncbi:MAG: MoaD/ThiS family protein [Bdellovibrionales bacterium]|nr:MoaD/ThiS family protein [Bdellovibrionales bacterium]
MKQVEVRLFGAFRRYIPDGRIQITLDEPCSIPVFKTALFSQLQKLNPEFSDLNLVLESALADENIILTEPSVIDATRQLALLPPVCGG